MSSKRSRDQYSPGKLDNNETTSSRSDGEDPLDLLRNAVKNQNVPLVGELLKRRPNLKSTEGGHILWDAIFEDNARIASMLIHSGADLNVKKPNDNFESSLLYELGSSKDPRRHELALLAMDYGARANDFEIEYILCRAIDTGSLKLVEALLRRGAPVRHSIVHQVVRSPQIVELLRLFVGGDFVSTATKYMRAVTVFYQLYVLAGDEGRIVPAVETLLSLGLDINVVNSYGDVLIYAIRCKKLRTVELLIEHGIDVNERGRDGILPLYSAASTDQSEVVEILLEAGAIIDARCDSDLSPRALHYGQCALHAACKGQPKKTIIEALLSHGADVNVVDAFRRTPFHYVKFAGSMNDAHRTMIKHFAILEVKGVGCHELDRKIIEANAEMSNFHDECLSELRSMSSIAVSWDSTFFSVLVRNERSLAFLLRSRRFRDQYDDCREKNQFPIYAESMEPKIQAAKARREAMVDRETALRETFNGALPYPVLENVIFYFYLNSA